MKPATAAKKLGVLLDATPADLAPRRLSASFGVAESALGETAHQFLRRADAALYRAKAGGRDRIAVDDEPGRPASPLGGPPVVGAAGPGS